MMNSLYPPSQVGGAEKSVSLLAEAFSALGDSVSVVSLHEGRQEVSETRGGVRVYRVPLDNSYWPYDFKKRPGALSRLMWHIRDRWNWKAARRVEQILDKEKPDIVHTNILTGFSVSVWGAIKARNIPLVHTLRDYSLLCVRSTLFRNGAFCEKRCTACRLLTETRRRSSPIVDAVVSNSEFVLKAHRKERFFRGVPGSVIYNIAGIKPAITSRPATREPGQAMVFGFIGRIEEEKGIEVVLKATQHLLHWNWRLKIAGRGLEKYVSKLRKRFPDERIEWLGFVDSREFFESIDVSVVSSVWPEPLPRTLIESFALGRAAICADAGGISEIARMGKTVEIYNPADYRALAALMDQAVSEPARWLKGGFCSPDAVNAFSKAEITAQYRNVYASAMMQLAAK